jgi:predicted DCC family thiol-disulfide oxidoreductase YuxK
MEPPAPVAPPPDPARHPILLFDGVCNLCHGAVRFVLAHDRAARFRFAPLQSEIGRSLVAAAGVDPAVLDTVVLVDRAGAHVRSDAALRVLHELGPPWSWLRVLGALPRRWRDAGYDWLARHRYAWFGRRETCALPDPATRERFLA